MSVRKTKLPAPVVPSAPSVDETPATRGMLMQVRTELIERMDHLGTTLRGEMQEMKGELREEIHGVRTELGEEIHGVRTELGGEIQGLKGEMHGLKQQMSGMQVEMLGLRADMHDLKANMARALYLIEEQNARNKVVLDGLTALMSRQDRVEQRVDDVEATVRDLAAARPKG